MSYSRRIDNVAVEAPGGSPQTSDGGGTICEPLSEPLSDHAWVQQKYKNFRGHVRGLVPQEQKLLAWADWLDVVPLAVFLAGCDHEVRGVRAATTDEQRFAEADLVLGRWALHYEFDLGKISADDILRLQRHVLLFSAC